MVKLIKIISFDFLWANVGLIKKWNSNKFNYITSHLYSPLVDILTFFKVTWRWLESRIFKIKADGWIHTQTSPSFFFCKILSQLREQFKYKNSNTLTSQLICELLFARKGLPNSTYTLNWPTDGRVYRRIGFSLPNGLLYNRGAL